MQLVVYITLRTFISGEAMQIMNVSRSTIVFFQLLHLAS